MVFRFVFEQRVMYFAMFTWADELSATKLLYRIEWYTQYSLLVIPHLFFNNSPLHSRRSLLRNSCITKTCYLPHPISNVNQRKSTLIYTILCHIRYNKALDSSGHCLAWSLFLAHTRLLHSPQNAIYDILSAELALKTPVFERPINVSNDKRSELRLFSKSMFSNKNYV